MKNTLQDSLSAKTPYLDVIKQELLQLVSIIQIGGALV